MASHKKKPVIKLNLVFVCTGNTCRSPMAEFIFKAYLKSQKAFSKFTVLSAGVYAADGDPMSDYAAAACSALGVTAENHKARSVTVDLVQNADAIVCMTEQHRAALVASNAYIFACGDGKERIIGTASELVGKDIPDPYGQDIEVYYKTAKSIAEMCEPLYKALTQFKGSLPKFNLQKQINLLK